MAQLPGRSWQQLSGMWAKKSVRMYSEPHWVLLLQLAVVVFWRAAVDRRLAHRLARAWHRLRAWRVRAAGEWLRARGWAEAERALAEPPEAAAEDTDAQEPLVVRGEGPVAPLEPEPAPAAEGGVQQWLRLLGAAEAPLLVCVVVSAACHAAVVVLQGVRLTGANATMGGAIQRVWVLQVLNYTLSTWWLALRLLNQRLDQSKSRPNVSGDLSNLEESVPATSRRFAQESSMVQLAKAAASITAGLICLKHLGYNISKLLAVTSLSGVA
ncbi:unnamed protein product, partial [Prorocentrum cordatum]